MDAPSTYVPALGLRSLTALYDPLVRLWSAARRMREALVTAAEFSPGMRVLELGAGPGRLAIDVKRAHPDVHLDAIDVDPQMVTRATRNVAAHRVDVSVALADMTQPLPGTYDRIYSTMVFHHLSPSQKARALLAARQALAVGGRFVVADFVAPADWVQWSLFSFVQQPLDGLRNTAPHRTGHWEALLRETFPVVRRIVTWRTAAGTIALFTCANPAPNEASL
jgi:cyclopropane fatty-acyl-phospholipid synthase-like methyltransferase